MKRGICCILCAVVLLTSLGLPIQAAETQTATYVLPREVPSERLTDTSVMTRITVEPRDEIRLQLGTTGTGRTLYLEWFTLPSDAVVIQLDADGAVIAEQQADETRYWETVAVADACTEICLFANEEYCISTMLVTEGELPSEHRWQTESPQTADLLIVLSTPTEAFEEMQALLAEYAVGREVSTAVAVLCDGDREWVEELQDACFALGITAEPYLLHCTDDHYDLLNNVEKRWEKNEPAAKLAALVDALMPQVLVLAGALTGDARTQNTHAVVLSALEQAQHSVSKVYETDPNGSTVLDFCHPLQAYQGKTAKEMSAEAYRNFGTRGVYRYRIADTLALHLLNTTVGEDRQHDDLLEHLSVTQNEQYLYTPPTPEPTEQPVATEAPTDEVRQETEAPTTEAVATESPERTSRGSLFSFLSCAPKADEPVDVQTVVVTAKPTEVPTAVPSEVPTQEPEPSPTAEPTAEPISEFDAHFVNDGSDTEIVEIDEENGRWVYRSDILAVEIERKTTSYVRERKEEPCVYFVAHIYEREFDSFRPTFASERRNGVDVSPAFEMADRAQCVLWITGDNLINNDLEKKGILLRGGKLFYKRTAADCIALHSDDRSMEIIVRNETTALDLLESGVRDCYCFGPMLINHGEIYENVSQERVRAKNPRAAVGMVEPGHLVAMVVDGRQDGYSLGVKPLELAELMLQEGCQVAYNMDGGVSAMMIFMGTKINRHRKGVDPDGTSALPRQMPEGLSWGYTERYFEFAKGDPEPR